MLGLVGPLGLLAVAACGSTGPVAGSPPPSAPPSSSPGVAAPSMSPAVASAGGATAVIAPYAGVFGPESVWDVRVGAAPLAANSAAQVANLLAQVRGAYGGVAAFNAHQYDTSLVTAAAGTPTTDVHFDNCQHKAAEPAGLAAQFADVPIPAGAVPSSGSDSELTVWQPSSDRLWELWVTRHTAAGWQACYGGRIDHVSRSPGYFTGGFGASASGLATAGGMVGIAEVRRGEIPHALALAIIAPADSSRVSYPAQRSDGFSGDPAALVEGTRLRLDPRIDVATLPGLTAIAREIAQAAQTYGFIVTDRSGAVAVDGESGAAEQALTGTDPWRALEHGVPDYLVLKNFPWQDLQVLPPDYGAS